MNHLVAPISDALATPGTSESELRSLYDDLVATARNASWDLREPEGLVAILATLPEVPASPPLAENQLPDRLRGAWLGRCAGCMLGKPVELGDVWTPDHLEAYLRLADAWPLADYIPALEPMPAGYQLRECWPETTRGNIVASARDDDIDYALLALHMVETYGSSLSPVDVATEWLNRLPFAQTYTAERAVYRNLVMGAPAATAADVENPYREWIGAQIRADVFGWIHPGDPRAAAQAVYADASLSHRANGVYGAMWAAALAAISLSATTAREAIHASLQHIPPHSRLATALGEVAEMYDAGETWESAIGRIRRTHSDLSWVHTINNAALVAAGVLWGAGDFTATVTLTVLGGWDTDSNGATAGSIAGALVGAAAIPERWTAPLNDTIRSSLAGFDRSRISELAARTQAQALTHVLWPESAQRSSHAPDTAGS